MSSKLYDGGAGVEAQPMAWRSCGAAEARPGRPLDPYTGASQAGAARTSDETARIEESYAQGVRAGEAAGAQRGAAVAGEGLTPLFANLSAILQELAGARRQVRMQAESSVVELAVAIARRVLHREISTDPEALLGLVKSAGERLTARETYRLRVAPADAAAVEEHRARLNLPPGLDIIPDAQLAPGSAVFETERGQMDASVGTQLDEIQRGLTDLMRRRAR